MRQIYYTLKYLLHQKGNNGIKIVSLTLGLSMSLVLFAQIAFDFSYDHFFPDVERIYRIRRNLSMGNNEGKEKKEMDIPVINAPVPGALVKEFPEIEKATVMTSWTTDAKYLTDGKQEFTVKTIVADSLFLDLFRFPLVQGVTGFGEATSLYISESTSKRIFGDVNAVGKALREGENVFTVRGVFRDIPKNSHLSFDAIQSMTQFGDRPGWQNNDAYVGYVKFVPGVDPKTVEAKIPDMLPKYYDVETESRNGLRISYYFEPISGIHMSDPTVKRTVLILWLMAFSILAIAAMNYVLISISSLANRAKSVGVHKCNGASQRDIFSMFISETVMLVLISLLLSVLVILGCQSQIEEFLHTSLSSIFSLGNLWVTVVVILVLISIAGVIPGRIFSVIPVTQVFHRFGTNKRRWKQFLLFIQFSGVAFMITLLLIMIRQYALVIHEDLGYDTENIVYSQHLGDMSAEQMPMLKEEFDRSSLVVKSATATSMPIEGMDGTGVVDPETKEFLFSSRFMFADKDFLDVMGITLKLGQNFPDNEVAFDQIVVNEKFVKMAGIKDNPVGKILHVGFTPTSQIIGVVKDFHLASLYTEQMPLIIFCLDPAKVSFYGDGKLILKLASSDRKTVQEFDDKLKEFTHDSNSYFRFYTDAIELSYKDAQLLRNAIFMASLVLFMITALGILGYVTYEISRRTKEFGIRRVNGASAYSVLKLLSSDILLIAFPAILLGMVVSWIVGQKWQEQFVVKAPWNISLFLISGLFVLAVILFCVVLRSWRVANANPVKSLKSE